MLVWTRHRRGTEEERAGQAYQRRPPGAASREERSSKSKEVWEHLGSLAFAGAGQIVPSGLEFTTQRRMG